MKKIYEIPQMDIFWSSEVDLLTASGQDDIASDMWTGGVTPAIFK